MALRMTRSGDVSVVEKRGRMTDAEKLRKRDRRFFMDRLAGYSVAEIGRDYGHSASYVHRRIKAIPDPLKRRYLEDHRRLRRLRSEDFAEEIEAQTAHYARSG